jgi:acetoin:2,6-dichlorophenolindophenol oxidoreductase subunit alpha
LKPQVVESALTWKVGMPNLGHTMEEGRVAQWLKAVGDPVRRGEAIAVVESDKASFDIEAPADGVLSAIEVGADRVARVGDTIAVVAAALAVAPPPLAQTAPAERPRLRIRAKSIRVPSAKPEEPSRPVPSNDLPTEELVGFWRDMMRIRAFEQAATYQSSIGRIYGALHSYEGQESCAVGVCSALAAGDCVASTHRGHGHTLAMGARMDRMMAELFGREDGYCRGKGGSLHITDLEAGMLGANGIVGAGYAIAAGAALNAKVSKNGRVSVVFFGDGAITRGTFHEVMNMASLWKLPLVLVCENNGYAQYMHWSQTMVFDDIASLARNYRMPSAKIDGNDIRAVHFTARDAVERARRGDGPTLIELTTQRFQGHSSGDPQVYRSREEVERLKRERDPIARLESELEAAGLFAQRETLIAEVEAEVAAAVAFAEASPYPDPSEVSAHVYA